MQIIEVAGEEGHHLLCLRGAGDGVDDVDLDAIDLLCMPDGPIREIAKIIPPLIPSLLVCLGGQRGYLLQFHDLTLRIKTAIAELSVILLPVRQVLSCGKRALFGQLTK